MPVRLLLQPTHLQGDTWQILLHFDLPLTNATRRISAQRLLNLDPSPLPANDPTEHTGVLDGFDGLPYQQRDFLTHRDYRHSCMLRWSYPHSKLSTQAR